MDDIRVSICVPADLMSAANELAACIGYTEHDRYTFVSADYRFEGTNYSAPSGLVQPAFVEDAGKPLVEPPWGADMTAAALAQSKIIIADIEDPATCRARPDAIVAIVGLEAEHARALFFAPTPAQE